MPESLREKLLAAVLTQEDLELPGLGTVRVRELDGDSRDTYEQSVVEMRGGAVTPRFKGARARLVVMSTFDPATGEPLFTDAELKQVLDAGRGVDPDLDAARGLEPPLVRQLVAAKIRDHNVISGAYKHVDGTSFAAPIVSSLAALLVEANPLLAPRELKRLLLRTARRLPHVEVDRQGWGVVDVERACLAAEAHEGA